MKTYDLIIIGGGSAGMASALGAYFENIRNILILEKDAYLGGILNQCIHNGFGLHTFKEELTGPEYASRFIEMINKCNSENNDSIICKLNTMVLDITEDLIVTYSNDKEGIVIVKGKAIVMATGCSERTRGNIAIPGSRPAGILTAGLAQRYLNIDGYLVGKNIFILGSGDIGLIMARRMTLEGAKVLGVCELMPYSNGLNRNIVQCLNDYDIPLYLLHTVKKIIGKDRLEKIVIAKVDDKFDFIEGTELEFAVDTLLLSVGLIPSNPLLNQLQTKFDAKTKGPVVDSNYQTSTKGIFACGNSLHVHDLVDYVSEEGKLAGIKAAKYIKNLLSEEEKIDLLPGNGLNYLLPSTLYVNSGEVILKFRVKKPYGKSQIIIKNDNEVIKKINKLYLLPAEMQTITIDTNNYKGGKITVEVLEKCEN
ncbi:MAG: pyridine nucleotide-disulfide oxidoreductase [Coprobacillus sp. 28_7]|nr:MAG: pyridine nucleotide-disulfide oxidoreductase [Coprobacillus sp. 28_7]